MSGLPSFAMPFVLTRIPCLLQGQSVKQDPKTKRTRVDRCISVGVARDLARVAAIAAVGALVQHSRPMYASGLPKDL